MSQAIRNTARPVETMIRRLDNVYKPGQIIGLGTLSAIDAHKRMIEKLVKK